MIEVNIQCLILWSFNDHDKWGIIKVNAKSPVEAKEKLKRFLKETEYIKIYPSLLEPCFNKFTLEDTEVIQAVIL